MKILLIDGQRDHLRVLKERIEDILDGTKIELSSSIEEAENSLKKGDLDVVVSEYELPDGNGLGLLKDIDEGDKGPAFILFTEEKRENTAVDALNAGVDRFIKKSDMDPHDFELLAQAIEQEHRHKVTKEKYRMANRALKTLSVCNHLLVRAENERDLLDGVCRAVIKEGGYRWAWVGYRSETEKDSIFPIAECSHDKTIMDEKDFLWYKEDTFLPSIEAVHEGECVVVQNIKNRTGDMSPLLEEALKRRYSSAVSLPLKANGETIGSMNIYAEEAYAFDEDEMKLLKELADDVSWGITSLRIRRENEKMIEELKKSENLYRTIFENTGTATMIVEEDTTIKLANSEFERITGYKPGELIGRSWTKFATEDELDKLKEYHKKRRKEPEIVPSRYESSLIDSSDEIRDCILNVRMIPDTSRSVVSILDITELKSIEKELREHKENLEELVEERTEQLRESNADLEAFAHSVSHDLKEPVRAIQGFCQIILEDCSESMDDGCEEYLQRIVKSSDKMELMINDFLDYSRISKEEIMHTNVDMDSVMDEAMQQLDYDIKERGAVITIDKPLMSVKGNRSMLTHIFSNLLSNSLKFTKKGQEPEIRVWSEDKEDSVLVYVEDNGIGIDQKHQDTIFKMFEKLHGEEDYPGTGIGLAIVKKGVERMGGEVGVESSLGAGSSFRLKLQKA